MKERFYSLDVFRGATVALMILVNTPGSWEHIYPPLRHAEWHGLTPTDLVFPFFLFAVGNAMAFVMPSLQQKGDANFWAKVLKRTFLIFLIGFLLGWFPFVKWSGNTLVGKPWAFVNDEGIERGVRILGVLPRIAICYFFASIFVYYFKWKGAIAAALVLLFGYWGICYLGNPADPFGIPDLDKATGWIGTQIDVNILGKAHIYRDDEITGKEIFFEPEGLLSSIAAIAQVILGYIIGTLIIKGGNNKKTVLQMLLIGAVLVLVGLIWHQFFPINKRIWSSSYTVITSGMGTMLIAALIYVFELVKLPQVFGKFFDAFGKNPLFIFVLSGALPRLLGLIRIPNGLTEKGVEKFISPFGWFYEHVCKNIGTDLRLGSFVYAVIMIIFYWVIAYIMDKRKIYVKV
jgi:predicted acyltransferase